MLMVGHSERIDAQSQENTWEALSPEEIELATDEEVAPTQELDSALVGQIISGLRHELANTLTAIRLNLSILSRYRDDPDRFDRHYQSLQQGVATMTRILGATYY